MTWDCCNAKGECVRGPGCPAGSVHHAKNFEARKTAAQEPRDFCAPGMCESAPGCRDTACPAHPGLKWSSQGLHRANVAHTKGHSRNCGACANLDRPPPPPPPRSVKGMIPNRETKQAKWHDYTLDLIMWLLRDAGAMGVVLALLAVWLLILAKRQF